ncbi:SNF2-related protein [Crenothrix sp.]|uniref:SNF2-related protein n=1 Tax=Crenothrix sp. TaxID=3100433 RepID=UPI00374D3E78
MSNDFFLFDTERLSTLTSEITLKKGLAYFIENRVFALDVQDQTVIAQVEGSRLDQPYWVELARGEDDQLLTACDCPDERPICKHVIAALYSYAEQFGSDDPEQGLGSAMDEAINERVKKGRNEVKVNLVSGNLAFGIWQASSLVSATPWQRSYHVHIRSLTARMNYCTCPDLASNRLGTCKHIEAVLHYAKKRPGYKDLKAAGSPISFVYLAWDSATNPQIRLHKTPEIEVELALIFHEFFNADGLFTARLPDDFFQFVQRVAGREDIQIGEDAHNYARQCAEDASHQLRALQISKQIIQAHGVLPGVTAKLFPYQIEGVAFLASRGRALLADDMGLGKTLQSIVASIWLADNAGVQKVLIICPTSLKQQWAREITKFTGRTVQVVQGAAENRAVNYRADALFFIINYELVLRDRSVICETLKPDLVILDEAQRIKNWRTKIAAHVKSIPSRYVFVLSGTPLENRLEDLYSLLQVIDARVLGPLWRCFLDFHVTDERGKVIGYRNLSELRRRISTVMLRRNRSLVKDQLPERTEVVLDIAMTPKQRELHDSGMSAASLLAQIARRRPLTPSEQNRMMASLQQARMACNAAGLVDKETFGSPKLDELSRLLEELCLMSNHKVVIFSQWALMTAMVATLVNGMGLGCVSLHGSIPSHKRGELMDKFEHDDAIQVFISTDAGGVGLNLQSASVLINLDMPWNPAVLDQRIARVHRLGQQQKVQVFVLLAEDSYEQRVTSLVKGKRDLFDNVVNPDAEEDVVGVSKKMLETLIDDLAGSPAAKEDIVTEVKELDIVSADNSAAPTETSAAVKHTDTVVEEDNSHIKLAIVAVQNAFKQRIQQIMGAGGGLLVILESCTEADELLAEELSQADLPVVAMAAHTLRSMQRLGVASPVLNAQVLVETVAKEAIPPNPLFKSAVDKLQAAEILLQQQCTAGVMDLLAASMLARAAAMAGQTVVASADQVSVWLYGELLPQKILTAEHGAAIVRVVALNQSHQVPEVLLAMCLADARQLCSEAETVAQ